MSAISYLNVIITEKKYPSHFSFVVNLIFDYLHTPASAVTFYVKCCKSNFNPISADVEP